MVTPPMHESKILHCLPDVFYLTIARQAYRYERLINGCSKAFQDVSDIEVVSSISAHSCYEADVCVRTRFIIT